MLTRSTAARMRLASGRFACLFLLLVAGCQRGSPDTAVPEPVPAPGPVVAPGATTEEEEDRAATLFQRASEAFEAGRPEAALDGARQVVEEYPATRVSGSALRLLARAALATEEWAEADTAAERYRSLLHPSDPARAEIVLLRAQAMMGLPDPAAALQRLLLLDGATPPVVQDEALSLARSAVQEIPVEELTSLAEATPRDTPVAGVLLARYARVLDARGRTEDARNVARSALEAGATGPDSTVASTLLDPEADPLPRLEGVSSTATLAGILPVSGSPNLREVAGLIAEGIEVATASSGDEGLAFELLSIDDQGDPARSAQAIRDMEEEGVAGVVGLLQDRSLAAAARARRAVLPLISPTAMDGEELGEGVYTLAGADPRAAAAVGAWAATQGYARVAILHSQAPESVKEADAVEAELRSRGTPVVGRHSYPARATFFQDPIRAAREVLRLREIRALGLGPEDTLSVDTLDRVALVVPIPAQDVEYVAPQLTFFGLDTLGIDIIGTSGWTDPRTFEAVDARHLDGVVATAPVSAGPGSDGYARFRAAYEGHFRRSLISPVPALGYDAALLLLEAIRRGGRAPEAVRRALENIQDLEGATGILSVVDGRVVRRQEVVRILNGTTIPAR